MPELNAQPPGDPELASLTGAISSLPASMADTLAACLLEAALAFERTGDPGSLTRLARTALTATRTLGGPGTQETHGSGHADAERLVHCGDLVAPAADRSGSPAGTSDR